MSKKKFPKIIMNVKQKSPKYVVVLTLMALILTFILARIIVPILNAFGVDIGAIELPVQEAVYMFILFLPIIFSYYLIDKPPHFTTWEVIVIIGVMCFNFFVFALVAPKLLPSVFQVPASALKMSVMSFLGVS